MGGPPAWLTKLVMPEIVLQREDFPLRNQGWIAFGQPRAATTDVLEYFCEAAGKEA